VLLDVRLGDDDGFEVCRTLTRARPGLAVLLASTTEHDDYDQLAASSGARGFVNKVKLLHIDFASSGRVRIVQPTRSGGYRRNQAAWRLRRRASMSVRSVSQWDRA